VLSPGNRAKPCIISVCKTSGELHTEDIAIERENSHFWRPHSHLTPPQQRTPTNIDIRFISRNRRLWATSLPLTLTVLYASTSILKQSGLKTGASLLSDSTRKTVFNAKWLSMSMKSHWVTTQWDIVISVSYMNFGKIATARSKSCNFRHQWRHKTRIDQFWQEMPEKKHFKETNHDVATMTSCGQVRSSGACEMDSP